MAYVTQAQIETFVTNHLFKKKVDPISAWKAVYELLLWCVTVENEGIPHIVETNALKEKGWREKALKVRAYLASAFETTERDLCNKLDVLMKGLRIAERQRQNYLGRGFLAVLKALLKLLLEVKVEKEFPYSQLSGLEDIGRGKADLVVPPPPNFRIIISAKWSLRHDRLRDLREEATQCKRKRPDIKFLVITNEFMKGRLRAIVEHGDIDAVYHVHKPLLIKAGIDPPEGLKDLSELFYDIKRLFFD